MKKEIKRAAALLTAGILLCGTVSCGGEEARVQTVEAAGAEPEYLSFLSPKSMAGSNLGKYWGERFAKEYERPIYVNYDGASYYEKEGLSYRELLIRRMESSSPDDLYIINAEDVLEFEKRGYWMDLSGLEFVNNLSDAARYQSTYKGNVFSVPLTFTGFGFYWNVTLLKEHGLAVPENLEEFMAVCGKLKAEGILPYGANKGYALTVPAMCRGLADLYGSADLDQKIADLNSGRVPVSTYMADGFEFLSEMIEKGYLDPEQALNADPRIDDMDLFLSGKCAFICSELSSTFQNADDISFEREFTGLPVLENGSIAVYGADSRLCVNPKSKHLDTVLEFIEMVGTVEALDESAEQRHMMSSAKDSRFNVSEVQQKMFELLQQPGQIPNQDFALHFNTWESIRDVGREICRGSSVEDACAALDEKQHKELQEYTGGQ